MTQIMVCPFHKSLLKCLRNQRLVVWTEDTGEIEPIVRCTKENSNQLHCIVVRSQSSLADVDLYEKWKSVPIALFVSGIGNFMKFMSNFSLITQLNVRVYLPGDLESSYTDSMILASLGIASAIVIKKSMRPEWEKLSDLMTYAVLGRAPHAPIDPFTYITSVYQSDKLTDFDAVYFNDPQKYVHVSDDGRVALSQEDLIKQNFIGDRIDDIAAIENHPVYVERREAWRGFFIRMNPCSSCPGWRICLGRFSEQAGEGKCRNFFEELLDVVEQYQAQERNKKPTLWQP